MAKAEDMKVLEAWRKYNDDEEFGCSSKFRDFFKNRAFLSKNDQISLLKSVKYYSTYKNKRITAPLFCYEEKCGEGMRDCVFHYDQHSVLNISQLNVLPDEFVRYSIEDCPLYQDENLLNKNLNEFANFIYQMRNKFVHSATLFHLSEEFHGSTSFMVDYFEYEFRFFKNKPEFKGTIVLKLSPDNLEKILNRNFKTLLENYVEVRKTKQLPISK